jgi:predicted HicB family RNase H-like nuclease
MARQPGVEKEPTSIRLTPEAKRLLALLAEKNGLSVAAWVETTIRREAKREKVE